MQNDRQIKARVCTFLIRWQGVHGLCITRFTFLFSYFVLNLLPESLRNTRAHSHEHICTHTGTTLRHSSTHSKTKDDRKALKQNIASNLRRENEMQHL